MYTRRKYSNILVAYQPYLDIEASFEKEWTLRHCKACIVIHHGKHYADKHSFPKCSLHKSKHQSGMLLGDGRNAPPFVKVHPTLAFSLSYYRKHQKMVSEKIDTAIAAQLTKTISSSCNWICQDFMIATLNLIYSSTMSVLAEHNSRGKWEK